MDKTEKNGGPTKEPNAEKLLNIQKRGALLQKTYSNMPSLKAKMLLQVMMCKTSKVKTEGSVTHKLNTALLRLSDLNMTKRTMLKKTIQS